MKMAWLIRHRQAESGRMARLAREEKREAGRGRRVYKSLRPSVRVGSDKEFGNLEHSDVTEDRGGPALGRL